MNGDCISWTAALNEVIADDQKVAKTLHSLILIGRM
jgi:hypothetical protein